MGAKKKVDDNMINLELAEASSLNTGSYTVVPSSPEVDSITSIDLELERYIHCQLCGGTLDFCHVTCFVEEMVTEDAECSLCRVKIKTKYHKVQ